MAWIHAKYFYLVIFNVCLFLCTQPCSCSYRLMINYVVTFSTLNKSKCRYYILPYTSISNHKKYNVYFLIIFKNPYIIQRVLK